MAFTGTNAPNGLGGSQFNTSSKAWYEAGNGSSTSRTSLRQEAPAAAQRGRQRSEVYWPSWWMLFGTSGLLLVIAAFSLATLGAHDDGMARCERNDVRVTGPHGPAEEHVDYEVEVGYVKGHYEMTVPSKSHHTVTLANKYFMLRDLAKAGHASTVLGAMGCVFAILSALSALALLAPIAKWGVLIVFKPSAREEMPKAVKRCLGPYLWPTAAINLMALLALLALLSVFYILRSGAPKPFLDDFHSFCPCRLVLFALLVAFYIVVAVAVAQTTNLGTQHVAAGTVWKCIPHPSWAWWLGVVACIAWLILTILGWHEERYQRKSTTLSTAEHDMQSGPYRM